MLKDKPRILKLIGIFFILIYLNTAIYLIHSNQYYKFLWFCYIGLIIVAWGVLTNNSYLIMSQINILTIPCILWTCDFFYILFTKKPWINLANRFFFSTDPLMSKLISLQHIYIIPIAILAIYLIKVKKTDAWKLSCLQLVIILILSRLFTPRSKNINCVFHSSLPFLSGNYYLLKLIVYFFIGILLTDKVLNFIFKKKEKQAKKPNINQKIPLSYHTLKGVVCLGILGCSEMQHTLKCVVLEHF